MPFKKGYKNSEEFKSSCHRKEDVKIFKKIKQGEIIQ